MNTSHNTEKANEFANKTIGRMHEEGLLPTPENYELWYVYYAGSNPDVVRAVDLLISSDKEITDERCAEIHQSFLSDKTEGEKVRQAGDRIQATIKNVSGVVSNVKKSTSEYNTALSDVTGKLNADLSKEDLEDVLSSVMSNTENMLTQNQELEAQLLESSSVMEELQKEMEAVRREAMTDGLTNLSNRKAFDKEIERTFNEAEEEGISFSLIMLDIDHFKSFNDNFGHQVGDQVLKLVAKTLTDGVKGRDLAARYGGEEFAIILPETELQGGVKVGDNLREAVATKEIINRNTGERLGSITLSAGVAQYAPGEKAEDLIGRADAALYTAKHNGRNQVAAAPMPGQNKEAG